MLKCLWMKKLGLSKGRAWGCSSPTLNMCGLGLGEVNRGLHYLGPYSITGQLLCSWPEEQDINCEFFSTLPLGIVHKPDVSSLALFLLSLGLQMQCNK